MAVTAEDKNNLSADQLSQLESLTKQFETASDEQKKVLQQQAADIRKNGANQSYTTYEDGTFKENIESDGTPSWLASTVNTALADEYYAKAHPTTYTDPSSYLKTANDNYTSWYQSALENANAKYDQAAANLSTAYDAALEQKIASLNSQLESSKSDYDQAAAKQDYYKRQAGDNTRLYNQMQGDTGGIGQAQYTAEQNDYDQAILEIDLARTNTINEINTAIAEAKANNDYEKANALYELGISQLEYLDGLAASYHNNEISIANQLDSNAATSLANRKSEFSTKISNGIYDSALATALGLSDAEKATYQQQAEQNAQTLAGTDAATQKSNFQTNIQLGIYDEAAADALGLSDAEKEQYKKIADYYASQYVASSSGSGSGSSGGSGGSSGSQNPVVSYEALYKAGLKTPGEVYSYLVGQGYSPTAAKNYANYFDDWLGDADTDAVDKEIRDEANQEAYDELEAQVANAHGPDWIMVPGYGRLTLQEVLNMVESGKIVETKEDGKRRYTKAN